MSDAATWKDQAAALRHSAQLQLDPVEQRTLLILAEDCEAIAAEIETAQQPGKPKPPGNPPTPPGRERPAPINEPPGPVPPPPIEPPPPPLSARKPAG